MNIIQSGTNKISSEDLWAMVCQSRKEFNESTPRLNDFHSRVADELEGEDYETFVVQNTNKTESTYYWLTNEQCMLVGMRESKSVRRKVIDKIKALDNGFTPVIPQTLSEALQLAADQAKQLELAAPKVAFVENLVERDNLMTATQVGQKHKMSAVKINKFLDELGGVYNKSVKRGRAFTQAFIDKGYGELKQTEMGYSQALFTVKGEVWINEQLISEGVV